ncbi:MAG TPA: hypothetical protein VGE39_25745 [Prosthecobacter sp.]
MSRNKLFLLLWLSGVVVVGWFAFYTHAHSTNCGGNNAAGNQAQSIAMIARWAVIEEPDHPFQFSTASPQRREELEKLARSHWACRARFLVSTLPLTEPAELPRRIIVVCDTPFRNVPKQWFQAPPTHAAAYSDGTSGLISVAEFAALDRSKFVFLDELYPPTSKGGK